jgi:chromosome partitioning protein
MPSIIAVFNNKGGVGKTTLTKELGYKFASRYRVLLVDADPQCNLSGICIDDNQLAQMYAENNNNNIWSALAPVFEGDGKRIETPACHQLDNNLYILPGHIDLSVYETEFAMSLIQFSANQKNIPGSIRHLILNVCTALNIHYVFVDMSPSLGPLNQVLLMYTVDYFMIPCNPDYFSIMALQGLKIKLPQWKEEKDGLLERAKNMKNATYRCSEGYPKLLGVTVNNFVPRNGQLTKGDARIVENMNLSDFFLKLKNSKLTALHTTVDNIKLGNVEQFGKMEKLSHESKKPVHGLDDDDIEMEVGGGGRVFNTYVNKVDNVNTSIRDIARAMLQRMQ